MMVSPPPVIKTYIVGITTKYETELFWAFDVIPPRMLKPCFHVTSYYQTDNIKIIFGSFKSSPIELQTKILQLNWSRHI